MPACNACLLDLTEAFAIIPPMAMPGVILKQAEIGPVANFIYLVGLAFLIASILGGLYWSLEREVQAE